MRGRIYGGLALVLVLAVVAYVPAVPAYFYATSSKLHTALYQREIRVSGASIISEKSLKLDSFASNSSIWWRLNHSEIERQILADPIVATASVRPCTTFALGCFTVNITERTPNMIASINNRYWVVGDDGGLLASLPLEKELFARLDQLALAGKVIDLKEAPRVTGLMPEGASEEVLKARYAYLKSAMPVIESLSDKRVGSVKFYENGELEVRFKEMDIPVVFGYAAGDLDIVKKGAKRLRRILSELGTNTGNLEKIDLAMDKVVVVSTKGAAAENT